MKTYKQDNRPAMQFYVDDYLSEVGLRLCSLQAKGLWIEMLMIMFKSDVRGTLRFNGKQMNSKDLADYTGKDEKEIQIVLAELEDRKIFSRLDDTTIYNRRMYRESQKEIDLKDKKTFAGRLGGLTKSKQGSSNDGVGGSSTKEANPPSSSSTPSSTSSSTPKEILFEMIWKDYPMKTGKKRARKHFLVSVNTEQEWRDIQKALTNYKESRRVKGGYIQNGSTWFNQWADWVEYVDPARPDEKTWI